MYLYNVAKPGNTGGASLEMMEWNYDFPTVLSPLLSASPFLERNKYNDTGSAEGIYAEAEGGKAFMLAFYEFIERHADALCSDPAAFRQAKQKILAFLKNRAKHHYFHLEGWDVFNLSEEDHAEQAAKLLARIERDNLRIRQAIEKDDPALLDQCEGIALEGASDFRARVSQPQYDYGWEPMTSAIYKRVSIFRKKGLKGVMSISGEPLTQAIYDDISDFDFGTAVVKRGELFGYINDEGCEITPICFDEAVSFKENSGYGFVAQQGRHGVIDRDGNYIIPCRYDKIANLRFIDNVWAAQEQGLWGLVKAPGTSWSQPPQFAEITSFPGQILCTLPGENIPEVYSINLVKLGKTTESSATFLENGYTCSDYTSEPRDWRYALQEDRPDGRKNFLVFDALGQVLFSETCESMPFDPGLWRGLYFAQIHGLYGVINIWGQCWSQSNDGRWVKLDAEAGVPHAGWAIPPIYSELTLVQYAHELFCYATEEGKGLVDKTGEERCSARYESFSAIGKRIRYEGRIHEHTGCWDGLALGFRDTCVYLIHYDGQETPLDADTAHDLTRRYDRRHFAEGHFDALIATANGATNT